MIAVQQLLIGFTCLSFIKLAILFFIIYQNYNNKLLYKQVGYGMIEFFSILSLLLIIIMTNRYHRGIPYWPGENQSIIHLERRLEVALQSSATGKYVSIIKRDNSLHLSANSKNINDASIFIVDQTWDGFFGLKCKENELYVSVRKSRKRNPLFVYAKNMGSWECLNLYACDDKYVAIFSTVAKRFIRADSSMDQDQNGNPLYADGEKIATDELFILFLKVDDEWVDYFTYVNMNIPSE